MENQKRKSKSKAKMAGVKSTFVVGQELLMTSFGKRDEANLEKEIANGNVKNLQTVEAYSVKYDTQKLAVKKSGNNIHAKIDNPLAKHKKHSAVTEDYRQKVITHKNEIKKKYENLVFGKTFNDNIHIQVISKILDIEKTFSYTIGNIVYSINNMNSDFGKDENFDDYMSEGIRTDEKLKKILPRCMYVFDSFGWNQGKNDEAKSKNIAKLKNMLRFIACIRNDSFHGANTFTETVSIPSQKYNLKSAEKMPETFDEYLKNKWDEVTKNYEDTSVVNINFLCWVLDLPERYKRGLSTSYFEFAILKSYKNIGFSITKLREQLFAIFNMNFEKKENLRPRMNSFCDYVLYDYYTNAHKSEANALVDQLRCSANDEEKEGVYKAEAIRISKKVEQEFNRIETFEVDSINKYSTRNNLGLPTYDIYRNIKDVNAKKFCNMVYVLTQFLDGKEINIFLTALHNIFEDIASFLDVMKGRISCDFSAKYSMFKESKEIAKCLEKIISLARMKKTLGDFNHQTLCDAISVLGKSELHADLTMKEYIDAYLYSGVNHNLRNFLDTSVIKSRKFNYLARYCNLSTVSGFAKNEILVKYVLERIDPKQIDRYCEGIHINCCNYTNADKINKLASIVSSVNIDKFEKVNNAEIKEGSNANDNTVRERNEARACVGLYLNVLYQIAKNLMNVNSRYALAFAMTERDMLVENLIQDKENKDDKVKIDYLLLTNKYLQEGLLKRATEEIKENIKKYGGDEKILEHIPGEYINKNLNGYCEGSTRTFRNAVAHMVMMSKAPEYVNDIKNITSYFALYHYCMQKHIMYCAKKRNKETGNEKLATAFEGVKQNRSYSKDAVKYLCLPFAYNVPRYKALTIEGLFDWSEYGINDK